MKMRVTDDFAVLVGYLISNLGPDPGQDGNNQAQPYTITLNPFLPEYGTDFGYVVRPASATLFFVDYNRQRPPTDQRMAGIHNIPHHFAKYCHRRRANVSDDKQRLQLHGTILPGTYAVSAPETQSVHAHILLATNDHRVVGKSTLRSISATSARRQWIWCNFGTESNDDAILLRWQTSSEQDETGFIIWRGLSEQGPFKPVSDLIPAVNTPDGAVYE